MKKRFKRWLDNLMWRLRYIPMERVEGGMLIVNKEKFEIGIIQEQFMISRKQLEEIKPMTQEEFVQYHKEQVVGRVAKKIVEMGEWEYEEPHLDWWWRYRFKILIAIKKK